MGQSRMNAALLQKQRLRRPVRAVTWVLFLVPTLLLFYLFCVSPARLPDPSSSLPPTAGTRHVDAKAEEGIPPRQEDYRPLVEVGGRTDGQKVAIIVVPEVDHRLEIVVMNAIEVLPSEWRVQIFHSPEINQFIRGQRVIMKYHQMGRVTFTPTINASMTYDDFSTLMKNITFWNQVEGEHVLTIQTDAILCSQSPYSIDDFLKYDWVGAPWKRWPHLLSGNGGLSLRRKSKIIETLTKCQRAYPNVEDLWFAYCFRHLPHQNVDYVVHLAPQVESMNFAVETLYSAHPFGVHKPWAWLTKSEMNQLMAYCPELLSVAPDGELGSDDPLEEPIAHHIETVI